MRCSLAPGLLEQYAASRPDASSSRLIGQREPGVISGEAPVAARLVSSALLAGARRGKSQLDAAAIGGRGRPTGAPGLITGRVDAEHPVRRPHRHAAHDVVRQLPRDAGGTAIALHSPIRHPQLPQALQRLLELVPTLAAEP